MRKHFLLSVALSTITVLSTAQFKNVKLGDLTNSATFDASISVNPRNPKNIIAAAGNGNVYFTMDGGATWENSVVKSPLGILDNPIVIIDHKGNAYYFHTTDPTSEGRANEKSLDQIVCHVSGDGGRTWDEGVAIGYNAPKDQDTPWASVDDKGNIYVTWTQYDHYGKDDQNCLSSIMLSHSGNGKKWSKPVEISQTPGDCKDGNRTATGSMPAMGLDGKIFITWSNQGRIFMDRSYDGDMWLSNDIALAEQKAGGRVSIPGVGVCNGRPVLISDRSKDQYKGVIYIVWADQQGQHDSNIVFTRTVNYGDYWTMPEKINDDSTSRHQYLPWATIDPATGIIYVVYYDRRAYDDNRTDVYVAYSVDAGVKFRNVRISESPFTPTPETSAKGYINIAAYKGTITAVWTRVDNGNVSVYTTVMKQEDLVKEAAPAKAEEVKKSSGNQNGGMRRPGGSGSWQGGHGGGGRYGGGRGRP